MPFELKSNKYIFAPKLIPTLLALICIPTLIALGFWQLDRADEKRVIDQGVNDAINKPALALNNANLDELNKEIYRNAVIKGDFDSKMQFLLDNRTHGGLPGYHVISPFLFEHSSNTIPPKVAVLINRGWIGYKGKRENIADISLNKETVEIEGSIKNIPRSIVLKEDKEDDTYSSIVFKTNNNKVEDVDLIQSINLDQLETKLGYTLLPIIIELDKTNSFGFIREWQPYYGSIDKHNAYALQWFAMASILFFLFFKLNIRKR